MLSFLAVSCRGCRAVAGIPGDRSAPAGGQRRRGDFSGQIRQIQNGLPDDFADCCRRGMGEAVRVQYFRTHDLEDLVLHHAAGSVFHTVFRHFIFHQELQTDHQQIVRAL